MSLTIKNLARSLAVLMIIPLACSEDNSNRNPEQNSISQMIKVSGEDADAATKTTLNGVATSWVAESDKVGIYSPDARTSTGGGGIVLQNAQFTAASSAKKSAFNGTMYWGQANTTHTFYAYYPYTEGSADATAVPVAMPTSQTQSEKNNTAHISALDFLVATPVSVTSPDNTDAVANEVDLKFKHLFTIIEFQIKGTGTLKAVRLLTNATLSFSSGTIDITQSTPAAGTAFAFAGQTGTSGEVTTTLTTAATLTSTNSDTKVYMVVNPCAPTGNCLIGLSADGTTWQYIYKTAPASGFKRGIKYVVSVDASLVDFYTVTGGAGGIWMDRNLGASQVATAIKDDKSYGYYYQWGRGTDGHQLLTSLNQPGPAGDTDTPGSYFLTNDTDPRDWRNPQNANLWQGVDGINNPCPAGFRIPTYADLDNERRTWATSNAEGAFLSSLKLPQAGLRYHRDGSIVDYITSGYYWSNDAYETKSTALFFDTSSSNMMLSYRSMGYSVRCIKN